MGDYLSDKFIEKLLKAFDDKRIKSKICDISSSSATKVLPISFSEHLDTDDTEYQNTIRSLREQIGRYEQTISELKRDSMEYQRTIRELKSKNDRLGDDIKQVSDDFDNYKLNAEKERDRLQNELVLYSDGLSALMDLYKEYLAVDISDRKALRSLISDKSFASFIVSCSRFDTLEAIWDYIKVIILNNSGSAYMLPLLNKIFDTFFELANDSMDQPKYIRNKVSAGDGYDNELHIRGNSGKADGTVRAVQLLGFSAANTGIIIRRSVVIAV